MSPDDLRKRQDRAANETLVIMKTDRGFRVHSPGGSGRPHLVTDLPDAPRCTCPDFEHHRGDPEWRCKHILAVQSRYHADGRQRVIDGRMEAQTPRQPDPSRAAEGDGSRILGATTMLLKRSVSPDGHIDSLSVEFSCPVAPDSPDATEARAVALLALQRRVVKRFLAGNSPAPRRTPPPRRQADGAVPARMLEVGGIDTRWGRRLFIAFQVNGRTLRLFGSPRKLAEHLAAAGHPNGARRIREGERLNLPCRVMTKPSKDGKYENVATVLPPLEPASRQV